MTGFRFSELNLTDAYCIEYFYTGDTRGAFGKNFEKEIYANAGIEFTLNETFSSVSAKNVIRGLHFQTRNPQAKLVCVLKGSVWDVIVDLREDSSTYKKWVGVELSAENHRALYVPRGFAHGFLSLQDGTVMLYQCDGAYDQETDTGIRFDDESIGVEWPVDLSKTIHSNRDLSLPSFQQALEKGALNFYTQD